MNATDEVAWEERFDERERPRLERERSVEIQGDRGRVRRLHRFRERTSQSRFRYRSPCPQSVRRVDIGHGPCPPAGHRIGFGIPRPAASSARNAS